MKTKDTLKLGAAYHEAGHAIAYLWAGKLFEFVTINPEKKRDEGSIRHITDPTGIINRRDLFKPEFFNENFQRSVINQSGSEAEIEVLPEKLIDKGIWKGERDIDTDPSESDNEFVCQYSQFTAEFAHNLIQDRWVDVDMIARALVEIDTLTYQDVLTLIAK